MINDQWVWPVWSAAFLALWSVLFASAFGCDWPEVFEHLFWTRPAKAKATKTT